jgi:glycosyltransferase involved in cell wall biosynthesis
MVPAWKGQEGLAEIQTEVSAGRRPRVDYLELARVLDADVTDMDYMQTRAAPIARVVARCGALVLAQILDAFLRQRSYARIVARADRFGLPLALLFKLTGGRRDLVLVSVWLSRPKKAVFLSRFRVQTHLRAIINYGSVQRDAAVALGVPPAKLSVALQPVDERFWRPVDGPTKRRVVAVGSEARDYATLVRALEGVDADVDIAVGSSVLDPAGDPRRMFTDLAQDLAPGTALGAPAGSDRITTHVQLRHEQLRELYARARVVVVPLHDVEFDAGVTAITEAMAMGKPVVVTRTSGQVDVVRDGEAGFYVPPGDPQALRQAIERLLDDPREAEQMGGAGRALVEERHRLDDWVQHVAGVVTGDPPGGR